MKYFFFIFLQCTIYTCQKIHPQKRQLKGSKMQAINEVENVVSPIVSTISRPVGTFYKVSPCYYSTFNEYSIIDKLYKKCLIKNMNVVLEEFMRDGRLTTRFGELKIVKDDHFELNFVDGKSTKYSFVMSMYNMKKLVNPTDYIYTSTFVISVKLYIEGSLKWKYYMDYTPRFEAEVNTDCEDIGGPIIENSSDAVENMSSDFNIIIDRILHLLEPYRNKY